MLGCLLWYGVTEPVPAVLMVLPCTTFHRHGMREKTPQVLEFPPQPLQDSSLASLPATQPYLCHAVSVLKLGSNRKPDLSDTLHLSTALLSHPCSAGAPSFVRRAGMSQWLHRLYQPVAVTLTQLAPMKDHPIFQLFQIILGWNNPSLIGKGPRNQRGSYGCGESSVFLLLPPL